MGSTHRLGLARPPCPSIRERRTNPMGLSGDQAELRNRTLIGMCARGHAWMLRCSKSPHPSLVVGEGLQPDSRPPPIQILRIIDKIRTESVPRHRTVPGAADLICQHGHHGGNWAASACGRTHAGSSAAPPSNMCVRCAGHSLGRAGADVCSRGAALEIRGSRVGQRDPPRR
jgi:hypothetical protein